MSKFLADTLYSAFGPRRSPPLAARSVSVPLSPTAEVCRRPSRFPVTTVMLWPRYPHSRELACITVPLFLVRGRPPDSTTAPALSTRPHCSPYSAPGVAPSRFACGFPTRAPRSRQPCPAPPGPHPGAVSA